MAITDTELVDSALVVIAVVSFVKLVVLFLPDISVDVPLSVTDNRLSLLSKLIPLTFIPFTILVPSPPKIDVPLKMLLVKLSMNNSKSIAEEGEEEKGSKYWQAGLTVMRSLLAEPYLSTDKNHQGIILHSIYHQPNGWDNVPAGQKIACGESSMWGDYHAREVALYVQRIIDGAPYYTFFNCVP